MHSKLRRAAEFKAGRSRAGFTLLEMVVTLLIIAVLATVAVPSYSDYLIRGRLQAGVGVLKSSRERLEQSYSDNRSYAAADGSCAMAPFTDSDSGFAYACSLAAGGQRFTLTATGTGPVAGFRFAIDEAGIERTLIVRVGWSSAPLPVNRFIVRKE
ncbi:MAG: type IV pilin protein [Burkholderiaceae bacterium]